MAQLLSSSACFDGHVNKYQHTSSVLGCDMRFTAFLPMHAGTGRTRVPAIFFLSGLTCNEDNFITKSGAPMFASKHGIALICPDTSPRGVKCKDDTATWDFGEGASYYVDATTDEYKQHYQMHTYVADELFHLVTHFLPIDPSRVSVMGHSVGGHGALTVGLHHASKFRCISVFAPMSSAPNCPWGVKALTNLLGPDRDLWARYDAAHLVRTYSGPRKMEILVDQGTNDQFLRDQLHTGMLVDAASENAKNVSFSYRLRAGYDHGYFYVASFVGEHVEWHAKRFV
ncbi:S-formylglutathione hydrolase [Allomyces macrogynus ATCC 38327]|uniref:S-formylglutathione hydrolase n=1 Tax=Allomyces macrogynus (strain ATCC 38327) TaxID=578462 RepID=A0A0L0SYQ9_ALLM3|nr:S-formylglutathione hydrolase [Allomyces macrogynus ATCC 38327]|eukprot:KNE67693.1 S-formylglutathione hydrolase [Allomyces macrogynus ATCC 38327]